MFLVSINTYSVSLVTSASMSEPRPTPELLSAIQGADAKGLKEVIPVENPAAKHDMAMVSKIARIFPRPIYIFSLVWRGLTRAS